MVRLSHQAVVATSPKWVVPVGGFSVAGESAHCPPIRVGRPSDRGEGWTGRSGPWPWPWPWPSCSHYGGEHMMLRTATTRTRFFGQERFTDAPHRDGSHGLGGQELRFRTHKYTERALVSGGSRRRQRLSAQTECTDSPKRRQVTRSFTEAYLERVRGDTPPRSSKAAQTHSPPVRRSQGLAWAAPLPPCGGRRTSTARRC